MDRAFRLLVETVGVSLVDAATMCATTRPANSGSTTWAASLRGRLADLAVLDERLHVVQTWVAASSCAIGATLEPKRHPGEPAGRRRSSTLEGPPCVCRDP